MSRIDVSFCLIYWNGGPNANHF